jgi:hypothetical protein
MKVIPPMEILDTFLVSSTVPETDAAEWAAGNSYALGQQVMRTANGVHRVYESMGNGNQGQVPEATAGTKWIDLGSTNRWRMLRTDANKQTTSTTAIVIKVKLPKRMQAIGLMRVDADRITVESTDGYSSTQDLRVRNTQGWYDYFYTALRFRTIGLFLDLPRSNSNTVFTITIERVSGGPVACGPVVFGNSVDLGIVMTDPERAGRGFTSITRDSFGNARIKQPKRIPSTSQRTEVDRTQVELVSQTLDDLIGLVGLYIGITEAKDSYFSALAILGVIDRHRIVMKSTYAVLSLDIEGL